MSRVRSLRPAVEFGNVNCLVDVKPLQVEGDDILFDVEGSQVWLLGAPGPVVVWALSKCSDEPIVERAKARLIEAPVIKDTDAALANTQTSVLRESKRDLIARDMWAKRELKDDARRGKEKRK